MSRNISKCLLRKGCERTLAVVGLRLIPGRVKPKTSKIDIHSFSAWRSAIRKDSVRPPPSVVDRCVVGMGFRDQIRNPGLENFSEFPV